MQLQVLVFLFQSFSLTNGISQLELFPGLQCSYNYDLEVHTHRGERSTKEVNLKINAQVRFASVIPVSLSLLLLRRCSYILQHISRSTIENFITSTQDFKLNFDCSNNFVTWINFAK